MPLARVTHEPDARSQDTLYSVIGRPPVCIPSLHENPILVSVVTDALFKRLMGGLGIVTIVAPLPAVDSLDSPQTLDADTFA
jgi:hypothetical protein